MSFSACAFYRMGMRKEEGEGSERNEEGERGQEERFQGTIYYLSLYSY